MESHEYGRVSGDKGRDTDHEEFSILRRYKVGNNYRRLNSDLLHFRKIILVAVWSRYWKGMKLKIKKLKT